MKVQIWMIFALITNSVLGVCQLSEDFSSDRAFQSELFKGDKEDFIISQGLLALKAEGGGSSILYAPITLSDTTEFSFWATLDFAPSAKNQLTYYLWSASSDRLEQSDAVYIQIGESGSDDNIELYYRKDGKENLLGEGELSQLGQDPAIVRVKVIWANDFIQVEADYTGGNDYVMELETIVERPDELNGFLTIQCTYTSSRSDKFYFDDLYVGPIRRDTSPPTLTDLFVEQAQLILTFSEEIMISSLAVSNFVFTPSISINAVSRPDINSLSLQLDGSLLPGTNYNLEILNVVDLSGNALDTVVVFELVPKPSFGELLINEILFNPEGDGADFIEIINTTDTKLSLAGLSLINSSRDEEVLISNPNVILPNQILAFTDDKLDLLDRYTSHESTAIYEQTIPRLNNDEGNISLDHEDENLDSFDYSEDFHDVLLDDVDGVSLERISTFTPTNERATWTSALSSEGFATPGLENSTSIKELTEEDITLALTHKHFSPNGDNVGEELLINYNVSSVYYTNIRIINDQGVLIKELVKNETILGDGTWVWDGRSEDGNNAPIGIYVIWVEFYNVYGDRVVKKLTAILADYLD